MDDMICTESGKEVLYDSCHLGCKVNHADERYQGGEPQRGLIECGRDKKCERRAPVRIDVGKTMVLHTFEGSNPRCLSYTLRCPVILTITKYCSSPCFPQIAWR